MPWRPLFARVKIKYRSMYSRILTRVHAVAMATGVVKKQGLNNGFCLFKKKFQSLDCFHLLHTAS